MLPQSYLCPPTRGEGGHTGLGADPICVGVGVPLLVPRISLEPMSGIMDIQGLF